MPAPRRLTRADVLPVEEYAKVRKARRKELLGKKKERRVDIGPVASAQFECFESMWMQVQEMLYIERGGDAQIEGELAAYNPLIPRGDELVATVMLQIDDPVRRKQFLSGLGGIEETAFLGFEGETIAGVPEPDLDRTTAEGKASAVQFLHFPFTPAQIEKFRRPGTEVAMGFRHPGYRHMTVIPENVRAALSGDFD